MNSIGRGVRRTEGDKEWVVIVTVDEGTLEKARVQIPETKDGVKIVIEEGEEATPM